MGAANGQEALSDETMFTQQMKMKGLQACRKHFRPRQAVACAQLSSYMYSVGKSHTQSAKPRDSSIARKLVPDYMHLVWPHEENLIQWGMFRKGINLHVVFRGSSESTDWMLNLTPGITCRNGLKVHSGVDSALHCGTQNVPELVWKVVKKHIESEPDIEGKSNLYLCGHALGGAYAQLTAAEFLYSDDFKDLRKCFEEGGKLRIFVNTYGSPQVIIPPEAGEGGESWDVLQKNTHHYVVEDDPVPRLATKDWLLFVLPAYIEMFKSRYLHMKKGGGGKKHEEGEAGTIAGIKGFISSLLQPAERHHGLFFRYKPVGDVIFLHYTKSCPSPSSSSDNKTNYSNGSSSSSSSPPSVRIYYASDRVQTEVEEMDAKAFVSRTIRSQKLPPKTMAKESKEVGKDAKKQPPPLFPLKKSKKNKKPPLGQGGEDNMTAPPPPIITQSPEESMVSVVPKKLQKGRGEAAGDMLTATPIHKSQSLELEGKEEVLRWFPFLLKDIFLDHRINGYVSLVESMEGLLSRTTNNGATMPGKAKSLSMDSDNDLAAHYGRVRPFVDLSKGFSQFKAEYGIASQRPRLASFCFKNTARIQLSLGGKGLQTASVTGKMVHAGLVDGSFRVKWKRTYDSRRPFTSTRNFDVEKGDILVVEMIVPSEVCTVNILGGLGSLFAFNMSKTVVVQIDELK